MQYKLRKSRAEVLAIAPEMVAYAKTFTDDVEFSPEDAARTEHDFLCEVVEAANFNDPRQTVISGSVAGVEKAREVLKAMGAKRVVNLPVSAPFHCSLMRPAAEALRQRLAEIALAAPRIPLVNNVDVAVQTDAEAIRDALVRQAFGPVRWVEVVHALRARGASHVVECGPGKVLAGMVKRIDAESQVLSLSDPASLAECKEALQ
jgi:[acyl-carrier-protein] S-malonyltransferase